MDHHVGGLLQHFLGFRGNDYAPRSILCSDNFAQVAPDFRGIGIDGADTFNGFFFPSFSGFHLHARTSRNLASKETPTIMEFPRAFNEERLQAFERPAVCAAEAGILAGLSLGPHNGSGEFQRIPEGCAMPAKKLSDAEITALLPKAKGWSV